MPDLTYLLNPNLLDLDDDDTEDEYDEVTDHCGCGYMKALVSIHKATNAMTVYCPDCKDYLEFSP